MEEIAKIILLNDENEFLFHLRDNNPKIIAPNQYALIGGGIKQKENLLYGLKREINEEIPDCMVKDIRLVGEGYTEYTENTENTEIDLGKLIGYSVNKKYNTKNLKNLLNHMNIFKGIINEKIDYINQRLTEGQRADYFKFDEFPENLNLFAREFIYQNKDKIFNN